jgi:hypothetical protein
MNVFVVYPCHYGCVVLYFHCIPLVCVVVGIGQPLDEFVIELRKLTKNCQFANTENQIGSGEGR